MELTVQTVIQYLSAGFLPVWSALLAVWIGAVVFDLSANAPGGGFDE